MQGTCKRTNAVLQNVVVNVFHLVTDLFLLLLPVPVVLRLRTDMKKKRKFFVAVLWLAFVLPCHSLPVLTAFFPSQFLSPIDRLPSFFLHISFSTRSVCPPKRMAY
jgi:hypothetical protein